MLCLMCKKKRMLCFPLLGPALSASWNLAEVVRDMKIFKINSLWHKMRFFADDLTDVVNDFLPISLKLLKLLQTCLPVQLAVERTAKDLLARLCTILLTTWNKEICLVV